jgi:hypothetical protein
MAQSLEKRRPWQVYALVALSVIGLVWAAVVDQDRNLWDLLNIAFSAWITYALWTGKRWAFTLSFMCATLGAGVLLVVAGMQSFLFEQAADLRLWGAFLVLAVWVFLLVHPDTKEYAGLRYKGEAAPGLSNPSTGA